jgi:hypothetical protein
MIESGQLRHGLYRHRQERLRSKLDFFSISIFNQLKQILSQLYQSDSCPFIKLVGISRLQMQSAAFDCLKKYDEPRTPELLYHRGLSARC